MDRVTTVEQKRLNIGSNVRQVHASKASQHKFQIQKLRRDRIQILWILLIRFQNSRIHLVLFGLFVMVAEREMRKCRLHSIAWHLLNAIKTTDLPKLIGYKKNFL